MEEQLSQLIDEYAPLSGVASLDTTLRPESICLEDAWDGSPNTSLSSLISRRSMVVDNFEGDPRVRLISDGATRFLHHQIVEIANGISCTSYKTLNTWNCRKIITWKSYKLRFAADQLDIALISSNQWEAKAWEDTTCLMKILILES